MTTIGTYRFELGLAGDATRKTPLKFDEWRYVKRFQSLEKLVLIRVFAGGTVFTLRCFSRARTHGKSIVSPT